MKRRSSDTARRAGLIAVAVGLGAALALAGARLAKRSAGGPLAPLRRHRGHTTRDRSQGSADQTYTCRCGTEYRVSGTDRHRVYWPATAPDDAPVLGDRCLECEAPFPGRRATRHA